MQFSIIETPHLVLRKIRHEDIDDMFNYASDPLVAQYTSWNPHPSLETTTKVVNRIIQSYENDAPLTWAIECKKNNQMIGTGGFVEWDRVTRKAEFGFALSRQHWNKGFGTEILNELIKYGFKSMNLNRIQGICDSNNNGCSRVMEKSGMTFEGELRDSYIKNDQYLDVKIYSMLRKEFESKFPTVNRDT